MADKLLLSEIRVLLIDADRDNAARVERMLSVAQGAMEVHGGIFSVTRVDDMAAALGLLRIEVFGVVLLDLRLPDCQGLDSLERIRRLAHSLPVIVLTDIDDDGVALAAIKAGAQDWLPRRDLDRNLLMRTIRHAIERKRAEAKLLRHTREVEAGRRRIEQQAEEIKARAEQLDKINRELDDFAYIASHDLKEPLRGIAGYCQIITEDYHDRLDAEGRRRLATLATLCGRLERLIDNLLTYCRVGRVQTPEAKVDLNKVVAEQIDTYLANGENREADISVASVLPSAKGDATLIGMVVGNLISNALKYNRGRRPRVEIGTATMDAGTIDAGTIDAGTIDAGTINAGESGGRDGGQCVFYVKDNGIGIEKKYHEDVFTLFRRLHSRKKYEGTGAGLTIVRKIVESHGGRIWLKSRPGIGSTFFVSLPEAKIKRTTGTRVKTPPHFSPAAVLAPQR